jgi:hypothetical protein
MKEIWRGTKIERLLDSGPALGPGPVPNIQDHGVTCAVIFTIT